MLEIGNVASVLTTDELEEPMYHSYEFGKPPLAVNKFVPPGGIVS